MIEDDSEGVGAVDYDTAFRLSLAPQPADFDALGHVNNTVYVRWAQEAAIRHWTRRAPPALQADAVWVVLRHEIDYRAPILPGDRVEARTWLGRASGPRFIRHVDIRKSGSDRPSASIVTDWCMLDAGTRRPRRVGPEVLAAFGVPG